MRSGMRSPFCLDIHTFTVISYKPIDFSWVSGGNLLRVGLVSVVFPGTYVAFAFWYRVAFSNDKYS